MNCHHLGPEIGRSTTRMGDVAEFRCDHPNHNSTTLADCLTCAEFYAKPEPLPSVPLPPSSPPAPRKKPRRGDRKPKRKTQQPPGVIIDRYGQAVNIADFFLGAQAFAVLGGPSTATQPLQDLARRGCLIFSVNNCPAAMPPGVRPHVWLHTDPTHKFHGDIWRDPAILKFSPAREWRARCAEARPPKPQGKRKNKGVRRRADDGFLEFIPATMAADMPGVFGYHRNTRFDPENFLWEPSINRGNDKGSAETNGWPRTINTMFALMRLAFYLGVRRLYLLGADFHMRPEQAYGFNQNKHTGGCGSNNNAYANMQVMFEALRPHFAAAGFEVVNCTPGSRLTVFPEMEFSEALRRASGDFEQILNAKGWYDDVNGSPAPSESCAG